jgi:DNA-binding beta-propeller fold protein YncE
MQKLLTPLLKFHRALAENIFCLRNVALLALMLLAGCASEPTATAPKVAPVWPPPPAEARIVYVRDISGPRDIGAKPVAIVRMANWITGVSAKQNNLQLPFGLSLDAAGNLLVTDSGNDQIVFIEPARKKWTTWRTVGDQSFSAPVAAVHSGILFYVADSAKGRVVAFDAAAKKFQFVITNELSHPSGLALLGDKLVVADSQRHQIAFFSLDGKFISKFGQRGRGACEFNFPTHVSVDAANRIYVTDSMNNRVQVFDASGNFLRQFGGMGDGPGRFSRPKGVATDTEGHAYVVDALFDNVQIFDDTGRLLLDWGDTGSEPGKFWLPNAIAINATNEIYVADTYNHRIQVFRYLSKP